MSEMGLKEVECYICKDEIKIIFVKDIGMYFCGKLECKIMVLTLRKEDWRPYVSMKYWDKAQKIIEAMDK